MFEEEYYKWLEKEGLIFTLGGFKYKGDYYNVIAMHRIWLDNFKD